MSEEFNPMLEQARQTAIAMKKFYEKCEKKTPKGKVFKGLRSENYSEKTNFPDVTYQWTSMGVAFYPVYEPKPRKTKGRGKSKNGGER